MLLDKYADWQSPIDCHDQAPEHGLIDQLPVITTLCTALFSMCADKARWGVGLSVLGDTDLIFGICLIMPGKCPLACRLPSRTNNGQDGQVFYHGLGRRHCPCFVDMESLVQRGVLLRVSPLVDGKIRNPA